MSTYTLKGFDTTPVVNYHFNRDYYMHVDQYLAGYSKMLNPRERQFNRNYRHFYIIDGENVWCPNFRPLCTPADDFYCEFKPESTEVFSKKDGLSSRIRVFVPVEGDFEVWTHCVTNNTDQIKDLTIIPCMSLEFGPMGSICRHDIEYNLVYSRVYPYHIKYSEWEPVSNQTNYCYFYSDTEYHSCDMGERHFYMSDYINDMPIAIKNKACSNNPTSQDNPIAAFCYKVSLKPGESFSYNLYGGGSIYKEQIIDRIENIFKKFDVEAELQKAKKFYDDNASIFTVQTPHKEFDDYVNTWVKKQILAMVLTNRCAKGTCVRNQLQDALGYGLFNKDAENYFSAVISLQQTNGFLRQHHVVGNAYPISGLGLLTMTDGTSWMVNCTAMYCNATQNYDYLNVVLPYKEGGEATVAEHLILGCEYMWNDRGMYGLSLLGDGDWTDPINGPGRGGKGVSTWTSMATVYAFNNLAQALEAIGYDDSVISMLRSRANELKDNINNACFIDNQYVAGFNDDGIAYGAQSQEEGKMFLNMHSWGMFSGVAQGDRLKRCQEIFDIMDTPIGPKVMTPAFTKWDPICGKVSVKLAGTNENGSIYCHATMFKVWADYYAKDGDRAYDTLAKVLPTNPNNPIERSINGPLYIPNQYHGEEGPNFGRSSRVPSTGTPNWYLYNVMYGMFGIEVKDGVVSANPCLPSYWEKASCQYIYEGRTYNIEVNNGVTTITEI